MMLSESFVYDTVKGAVVAVKKDPGFPNSSVNSRNKARLWSRSGIIEKTSCDSLSEFSAEVEDQLFGELRLHRKDFAQSEGSLGLEELPA